MTSLPHASWPRSAAGRSSAATLVVAAATVVAALGASCKRDSSTDSSQPAASVSALALGIPVASASVLAAINPRDLPIYNGPFGSVEGTITVTGDPPPRGPGYRIHPPCEPAKAMYEHTFRAGVGGVLADAIVGVTEYPHFVPARDEAVSVRIRNCTFSQRTVVLTYGQRLEVTNDDDEERYLPHLEGAKNKALMVALPKASPVKLYPLLPGIYQLQDDLKHPWMKTPTFVVQFATHDVSRSDGRYRIERVPVGKVKVSARHPAINDEVAREIEVTEGKATRVDLALTYKAPAPPPDGSAIASAKPAGSAPPVIK